MNVRPNIRTRIILYFADIVRNLFCEGERFIAGLYDEFLIYVNNASNALPMLA